MSKRGIRNEEEWVKEGWEMKKDEKWRKASFIFKMNLFLMDFYEIDYIQVNN